MDKLKICAYCRVSTDKEEQINSLNNQQSYFRHLIEKQGHTLTDIYIDEGLTGTKLDNRQGLNKMLYDAGLDLFDIYTGKDRRKSKKHPVIEVNENRKPLFDEIWMKNTSRFARNTLSFDILQKLRQKGVYVYFIEQNINTRNEQDFFLKLFQAFDEMESQDKSLKVRTGIKEATRQGKLHTSGKLYGYKYIKAENRLEIIPEEAQIIRKIFEMYSQNKGVRQISNYLESQKLYTRDNKPFGNSSILRIIDNEKYTGFNNRLKHDTGLVFNKNSYPKVKETYDIQKSDRIPPIIPQQLFDKCKELRNSKISTINQRGLYKGLSKYSRLLVCGKCSSPYHANIDNDRRRKTPQIKHFYNCSLRKRKGKSFCDSRNVNQNEIDKTIDYYVDGGFIRLFKKLIRDLIISGKYIYYNLINLVNNDNDEEIINIKGEIDKLEAKNNKIIDLYATDEIKNKDYILTKLKALEIQIHQKKERLNTLQQPKSALLNDIKKVSLNISILKYFKIPKNITRDEIIKNIDKIIVLDDLQIIFNSQILKFKNDTEQLKSKIPNYKNSFTREEIKHLKAIYKLTFDKLGNVL